MEKSKKYRLNTQDFIKGLLISILGAGITVAQTSLQAGAFDINYALMGTTAISAGLAYITKNFFENAK